MIVGFCDETLSGAICSVLKEMGVSKDAVITSLPGSVCIEVDSGKNAPYLIVRDTDKKEGEEIAENLRSKLNIDVEFEKIDTFYPRATPVCP